MDGDGHFERFRDRLLGGKISFVRLACEMLLLYVDCRPGDGQGFTFWLNPDWQISTNDRVIAHSDQACGESEEGPTEEELDRVSTPIAEALFEQPITAIQIDRCMPHLLLTVADAIEVKTLAASEECDHLWHIRDNSIGLTLYRSSSGWMIRGDHER